ncbi:hypothetical protein [Streptomyces sp. NPDC005438]|uniref:hypothetical protein n=1 Tax=Streptomyces sp. NPDC005438 TaxID=3156880 RepID=UPI0033A90279
MADETVDGLLEGGCAPGEVLVLTTGEPHPWARHELSFGEQSYWAQLTEGTDVFCAAATDSLAGTRRDTVVVAVNGGTDEEVAEALPRAMAAAERELVVCGDPGRLRTLF